jgi:hypothetical protein
MRVGFDERGDRILCKDRMQRMSCNRVKVAGGDSFFEWVASLTLDAGRTVRTAIFLVARVIAGTEWLVCAV